MGMKTTFIIFLIAAGISALAVILFWMPSEFSPVSAGVYVFLFAFVPMVTGQQICRSAGVDVSEWTLMGIIILVFLMWCNLGVLIGGSASQSIPIVLSNVAVTNLAAMHPSLKLENPEEFKTAVFHFFSDAYKPKVHNKLLTRLLAYSPAFLGYFGFMFFSYLGFKLMRRQMLRDISEYHSAVDQPPDGDPPSALN